jgi:hypothetical protein
MVMRRRKPRKPREPRQINLRIDEELRRKLEATAKERQISTNQLMTQLLEDGLNKSPEKFAQSVAMAVVQELGVQQMGSPRVLLDTKSSQQRKKEGGNK